MGQYYMVVNKDKKQFLYPHKLGDGLKLLEFGLSAEGTMSALAILLSDGNGRGGGDLGSDNPIVGSWAGDRIVITGDYADPEPNAPLDKEGKPMNLYDQLRDDASFKTEYTDISEVALAALMDDDYFLAEKEETMKKSNFSFIDKEVWAKAKEIRAAMAVDHPHKWAKIKKHADGKYDCLTYCVGCGQFRRVDEATGRVTEIRH